MYRRTNAFESSSVSFSACVAIGSSFFGKYLIARPGASARSCFFRSAPRSLSVAPSVNREGHCVIGGGDLFETCLSSQK